VTYTNRIQFDYNHYTV